MKRLMIVSALAALSASAYDFRGIFPESIKCVSIVAPSSQADNSVVRNVTNELGKIGIKTKVMPTVWTYTDNAAARARDIETAWLDPETDLILCSRGGNGGFDTVKNLNFEILKSRNVPFVGYSNISTLMNAFIAKGVKRPITGPLCTSLINYPNTQDSILRLGATVGGENLAPTQLTVLRAPDAAVSGKSAGGHWPSIAGMDAEWLPDTAGRIVFLEINNSYNLQQGKDYFDTLKGKGFFTSAAAIVLCDMGITGSNSDKDALRQYIKNSVTCAVFSGYPYGHVSKLYAIDFDRTVTISPSGLMEWENTDANSVIDVPAGATETISGITGNTHVFINTQGGTGTARADGANDYVGDTTFGGGTLEASVIGRWREPSSLGARGTLNFNGGTFRYTGTDATVWDWPVTFGAGTAVFENNGDVTAAGSWTQGTSTTFKKNGTGKLAIAGANNTLNAPLVRAGTFEIADGENTINGNMIIGDTVGGGEAGRTRLVVSGGNTTCGNIYIGQNTAYSGEYWADFIMTGGTIALNGNTSLFLANRDVGHVFADISGGKIDISKNLGYSYEGVNTAKYADLVIRDSAVVEVASGANTRLYFDSTHKDSKMSLAVKDGGTLSTSFMCRYISNTVWPTILFDGGKIIWAYDISAQNNLVFKGKDYYEVAKQIYVGSKGVSFSGANSSHKFIYSVSLVATNSVDGMAAAGVSFAKGRHFLNVENSWEGATVIAGDAELNVSCAGAIPANSDVVVDGTLVLPLSYQVASLALNGTLKVVQGLALHAGNVSVGDMPCVNLYTTDACSELVSEAGTYPVLTTAAANIDALRRLAMSAKSGNGGYFTVAQQSGVATMSLVIGDVAGEQPDCAVEGTDATSTVEFRCICDEIETVDGVKYVKPGTMARLSAVDTTGGMFVGCWRDETTGDIYWGDSVGVQPTNHTTYTAIFGKAWLWNASAKTITDGDWTFGATAVGNEITVNTVSASPAHGVLNFSTPVRNANGEAFKIVAAGNPDSSSATLFGSAGKTHSEKLTKFYLGGDMTGIGKCAFSNCVNLAGSIIAPKRMKQLAESAFFEDKKITHVRIEGVTKIGRCAFRSNTSLKSVRIGEGLRVIDYFAFNGCGNLETVTPFLPDSVEIIGRSAFYCNYKLSGDLRMAGVKLIKYSGLSDNNISSVYMPAVTNLGHAAFRNCPATNYVFGAHKVYFDDEEHSPLESGYQGYGHHTFLLEDNNKSVVRHLRFPGLAPHLPAYADGKVGSDAMFGKSGTKATTIMHGSWRADKEGWNLIADEIGSRDLSGKTLPGLEEGDRRVRGVFYWTGCGSTFGWLVDTAMPGEPPDMGTVILFR